MTDQHTPYPVRVDASTDVQPSRWLWLVKWLLLVPHAVVLVFLWIAFTVLTVVAWFAILVTGRYPRAVFDFNVGVLRWSWRVHYYGYGALGTDRYPPFTLADVPDYPARLDVPHPERLSRGLVLVKSWLLALPHLLVVAVFAGGGLWAGASATSDDGIWDDGWGAGGLIGLLVLVAGIVLLFSGRYPRPVYDFVLGMDRWVLRVAAYVALMTDRYPPFRLDMGGTDPGSLPVGPAGPVPPAAPAAAGAPAAVSAGAPAATTPGRWTAGRAVALVVGTLLLVTSTGMLVGGGALAWADTTQRDDGYLWTPTDDLATDGYALAVEDLTLDTAGEAWVIDEVLGDARLEVTAADPSDEVFVGVARAADAAGYLGGVAYREIDELGPDGGLDEGRDTSGGAPAGAPADEDFWVAQTEGNGTQTLTWTPSDGDWTVVVMRADSTAGLDVDARAGVTTPGLPWLWGGLLVAGGAFLVIGALLVAVAVRRAQSTPPGAVPAWQGPQPWPQPGPPSGAPAGPPGPPAPRQAPSTDAPVGTTPPRSER